MALGAGSSDGGRANVVSFGAIGGERTLINVAPGALTANSTEAVNGSQLYATNQKVASIGSDINKAFKAIDKANGGVAMAMAMGGLTMPDNKTFAINASMGFFENRRQAFAIQAAAHVDSNWIINGAIGFSEEDSNIGGRVGITAAW